MQTNHLDVYVMRATVDLRALIKSVLVVRIRSVGMAMRLVEIVAAEACVIILVGFVTALVGSMVMPAKRLQPSVDLMCRRGGNTFGVSLCP